MKTKSIVIAAIALVAGYVAGSIIGYPATDGNGSGNIAKVSKYNKVELTPTVSAFQEKILNDKGELSKAAMSLTFLTSRMEEFSMLVDLAENATKNIQELELPVERLVDVRHTSQNAAKAGRAALESFNDLISEKPGQLAAQYEKTSQNLTLAYLMTDRQVRYGKDFVRAVDLFLKDKDVNDYLDLAAARDLWAEYCKGSSIINGDSSEQEYWTSMTGILGTDVLSKYVQETVPSLESSLKLDEVVIDYAPDWDGPGDQDDNDDSDPGDLENGIKEISNSVEELSDVLPSVLSNWGVAGLVLDNVERALNQFDAAGFGLGNGIELGGLTLGATQTEALESSKTELGLTILPE